MNYNNHGQGMRMITFTETLIISRITKTVSDNCFIIHSLLRRKMTNTLSHGTQFDIALGNHALQVTYRLVCFQLVDNLN